jgi:3-dehydroquinate dehydratase/shikimate dehydrogenase
MKIAVPITSNMEESLKDMETAYEAGADIVELRIDSIADINLEKLIFYSSLPVIATNRVKSEGGNFNGSEGQRIMLLEEAVNLGANYVDLELNYLPENFDKRASKLIVSYHNFAETPENLDEIYKKICDKNADIVKIATKANNEFDVDRMIDLIEYSKKDIIGICMGELGKRTRLHPKNYLTFACLPGKESAPGQMTLEELKGRLWT